MYHRRLLTQTRIRVPRRIAAIHLENGAEAPYGKLFERSVASALLGTVATSQAESDLVSSCSEDWLSPPDPAEVVAWAASTTSH